MKRTVKKKWTDKANFYVNVDVFKVDIVFVCNCNEEETKEALKKACGDNYVHFKNKYLKGWDNETALGRMIPFQAGFIVLLKNCDDNFRTFVGVMVHEITHVVQRLLGDRRIPLNEDTEEVHAYLTEYITREALLKLYD